MERMRKSYWIPQITLHVQRSKKQRKRFSKPKGIEKRFFYIWHIKNGIINDDTLLANIYQSLFQYIFRELIRSSVPSHIQIQIFEVTFIYDPGHVQLYTFAWFYRGNIVSTVAIIFRDTIIYHFSSLCHAGPTNVVITWQDKRSLYIVNGETVTFFQLFQEQVEA